MCYPIFILTHRINIMKELTLGDTVDVNGYVAVVRSINDYSTTLVLDEGTYFEYAYECPTNNIQLDDNGDWWVDTDRTLMIGDVVTLDNNEYEYTVINIQDDVATLKRQGDIKHYHLSDIDYDVRYGFSISSYAVESMSATVRRKLEVYEVQSNVFEYKSFEELKEIYKLLGKPTVEGHYGLNYENIDIFNDSLQYGFGLVVYWDEWDTEWDYVYKHCKILQGAVIKELA